MILPKNKKIIIMLGAITLLIFFHYINVLKPIENLLYNALSPISSNIYKGRNAISNKYQSIKNRKQIDELYNKCLDESKKIETFTTKITILEGENKKLKEIVDYKANTKSKLITTRVIGINSDHLSKMIIVDVGKDDGIKTGQPVIASGNILIGITSKVENKISFVRLINDNQSKIAATMLNKDKSLGIVEGGYGLSLRMTLIPREEIILLGDKVITSGLEKDIPSGILIGEVAVAENEAYQPFQQAVLNPATNLSKLDIVSIIIQEN